MATTATASASIRSTEELAAALRAMQEDGVTLTEISKGTEVHRSTISQLVNQGVAPAAHHQATLWQYVDAYQTGIQEAAQPGPPAAAYKQAIELWPTEEYVAAMGWCRYIRAKRKMGVLIGEPGSGKTTILREIVRTDPGVPVYVEAMPNMRVGDLIAAIAQGIGAKVGGNSYSRMQQLIEALRARDDVTILVDEAEYLRKWDVDKLEYLRKIWDNTGTPVILAGTPVLETILKGAGPRENLAQLYRRKYELQLKGISAKGALTVLHQYYLTTDAAQILAEIAADVKHGGLGNMVEILDMCLETAAGGQITEAMVRDAKKYKLMY